MSPISITSSISGGASLALFALALISRLTATPFPLAVYLGAVVLGGIAGVMIGADAYRRYLE